MRRTLFALVTATAIAAFVPRAPADDHRGGGGDRDHDHDKDTLQLVEATIADLHRALDSHLISHKQLVEMYQARIAAYDKVGPTLNAFLHVNGHAVDDARRHDDRHHHGDDDDRGPLAGIPILLKDNIDTHDLPTTAGSVALAGSMPPHDAFIAQRLRDAGAIVLGKGTLTEFANFIAIGMPSGTARSAATASIPMIRGRCPAAMAAPP